MTWFISETLRMTYQMRLNNNRRPALEPCRRRDAYQALASLSTILLFFSLILAISSSQAFGGSFGLVRQSTQQSRDKESGGSDEKGARAIEAGKPIKSELAGGQQHSYQIRLNANQFLKVIIEQQGIDVAARVFGPDGKEILEVDSEIRSHGQETVSLVGEAPGDYRLIVAPKQHGATSGR